MVRRGDVTEIGGPNLAFPNTQWTEIVQLQADDPAGRQERLGRLLARYWKPIYGYLRRKGYNNEEAKDLTQGFVQAVVLGRGLVDRAVPLKGRFRTFLLTALDRYVTDVRRHQAARVRHPAGDLVPLEGLDPASVSDPSPEASPDEAFALEWARSLLDRALAEVESDCRHSGKEAHWELFRAKIARPILEGAEAPSMAALCAAHGLGADIKRACNMLVTVQRHFRLVLKRLIREVVSSDDEVAAEMQDLMQLLARKSGARGGLASPP